MASQQTSRRSYEGICGLAAPVRIASGDVVGALSITVVTTLLDEPQLCALAKPLIESARRLSLTLGYIDTNNLGGVVG